MRTNEKILNQKKNRNTETEDIQLIMEQHGVPSDGKA